MKRPFLTISLLIASVSVTQAADIGALLESYRSAGPADFSAERGKAMWTQEQDIDGRKRACSSCHMTNPASSGRHARTGKRIDPMAPSVNRKRFTDAEKVAKWFKRNCKWTLGRECTPQEKGDLLTWLNNR
jgi:hypothetical protein